MEFNQVGLAVLIEGSPTQPKRDAAENAGVLERS